MSLLGIDLGTTVCKAASYSLGGNLLAAAHREHTTLHPAEGRAELDSQAVWDNVRRVITEVAAATTHDPITALSVSSYGEAMVPVTRDRHILGTSILCTDSRGAAYAEALEAAFGQKAFYGINPNIIGPHYSLPKLLWLRDNQPDLFGQAELFLLGGDFVAFMLGCEPATANSLANRTLLFDLDRNDWSEPLLAWSGIDRAKLAPIVPGGQVLGSVANGIADELGLPRGVLVVAGGHDQCCNALGSGCIRAGTAVCGIGTFECITPVYTRRSHPDQLLKLGLNIEHHVVPNLFVSFIYNQGAALVKWFRDTFAADDPATDDSDIYARLNGEMPADPTRLLVLPHFDPPQCPRHIPDTAGVIAGLKTTTTRGEILKAIMECETLYFVDSIDALKRVGVDLASFIATGGGAKSDAWLQIKADIFGIPFIRPRYPEGSLLGAAMLAGLGTGAFTSPGEAVDVFVAPDRTFEPDAARHERYRQKQTLFRDLFPTTHPILKRL